MLGLIPKLDAVEDGSGRVSSIWLRWLNALRDAVNSAAETTAAALAAIEAAATTLAATVTALVARVVLLEAGLADVPFNAANFSGSGAMTWTVTSATNQRAKVAGSWLDMTVEVAGTVGGTPTDILRIALPFGKVGDGRSAGSISYLDAGTAGAGGVWIVPDGSSVIWLFKNYASTVWTAGTATIVASFRVPVR